ncbi:MAG: S24 family peptidase [Bdellovibrionota bacterium]
MYYKTVGKKTKIKRYKNEKLLIALGEHCKELRLKNDYTIDRMYREGDQLSTSVIHRLENGAADTQISVFYRYAQVLGLPLKELFNFNIEVETSGLIIPFSEEVFERPKLCVPYYNIKVAAGLFGKESLQTEQPKGWVKVEKHRGLADYFATHVIGNSMAPGIPSGSLCLFRLYQGGSRQNKIVLIRARGPLDPDTQESFVVKKYKRLTAVEDTESREQVVVHLISENKAYLPIVLMASNENQIEIIAEFIEVIE